jgi:hypothetical protein
MNGYRWLRRAVLVALILASICSTLLILQVLYKERNKTVGIVTLYVRVSHYFV